MRDPLSASPFALERLTADEWEELVFLLAHRKDQRVVRLRAPDGGLDTLLPDDSNPQYARRGWQAKRFTGSIHWGQCEESLERAHRLWKVEHVTFAFPRDLTRDEHLAFTQRLGGRDSVTADYVAAGGITAELIADDIGERIARRFFGDRNPVGDIGTGHARRRANLLSGRRARPAGRDS